MKKKSVLATVVATLMAGLSLFSGVPASAEWQGDELVVFDVIDGFALVGVPERWEASWRTLHCSFFVISTKDIMLAPIAEQIKYGDVIRYPEEVETLVTCVDGINKMDFLVKGGRPFEEKIITPEMGYKLEIVGSVLEEPFENIGSVTVDGKTSIQITDTVGIRYVFEESVDDEDVGAFIRWEHDKCYTGFELFHEEDAVYSEELANEYNKESGRPIWIRPNEDGDVNSDDTIDSADAAVLLEEIALYGVGDAGRMNASENKAADVNSDGTINAQDAAVLLSYSAEVGSGMLEGVTLKAYANR